MRVAQLALMLSCLVGQLLASTSCRRDSDCPSNSYCSQEDYCLCNSGWIFNCTDSATDAPMEGYLHPLVVGQANYYVLQSETGKTLYYKVHLSDSLNADMRDTYAPNVYIDNGIEEESETEYDVLQVTEESNSFYFEIKVTLGSMSGTSQPQKLILLINCTAGVSTNLAINYSYSEASSNNIFMILAYVAGGLFLATTVVMTIILCKKRRSDREEQAEAQPQEKQDLSYFDECMPSDMITPQALKEHKVCCICLQEYDFNSVVRMTVCKHCIHSQCLDKWCLKSLNCPMCRTSLTQENIEKVKAERSRCPSVDNSSWIINSLRQEEMDHSSIRAHLNNDISNIYTNRAL